MLEEFERQLALPRHDTELWAFEYQVRRYLKNLSEPSLDSYFRALAKNLAYLLDDIRDRGTYSGDRTWSRPDLSGWWLRKFSHVKAEYVLRARDAPDENLNIGKRLPPPLVPTNTLLHGYRDFVVKYGERSWLEPLLKEGEVRLSPASKFNDGSFDVARKDNELAKNVMMLGDAVTITTQSGDVMKPKGDVTRTIRTIANYFTFCSSTEFDSRLFSEFPARDGGPADSCVVIFDVEAFHERLEAAMAIARPGWFSHFGSVGYYDPFEVTKNDRVSAGMSKEFSFGYQREYRFLCTPMHALTELEYLTIEIGCIDDIAGLYDATGTKLHGLDLKEGERVSAAKRR